MHRYLSLFQFISCSLMSDSFFHFLPVKWDMNSSMPHEIYLFVNNKKYNSFNWRIKLYQKILSGISIYKNNHASRNISDLNFYPVLQANQPQQSTNQSYIL